MVKLQPSKLAMRVRFPLPAPRKTIFSNHMFPRSLALLPRAFLFTALFSLNGQAQTDALCEDAQQQLSAEIRSNPQAAVSLLGRAIQSAESCAPRLLATAIAASGADGPTVGMLLTEAIQRVPAEVVAIADSAIGAAPSASDVIAEVVQQMMGDCDAIAEEARENLSRAPEKAIMSLEDALRSHENCACALVRVYVRWAAKDLKTIQRIVATAVRIAPVQAASITECAAAELPEAVEAIQAGLEEVLVDFDRGPGLLAAGEGEDAASSDSENVDGENEPEKEKEAGEKEEDSEEELSGWYSLVLPPNFGFYFISPSSGTVIDRGSDLRPPMSPSNPELREPASNE